MNRMLIAALCAAGWLFAGAPAWGAETGSARRATEMLDAPYRDAATVGALERGDAVQILSRRGGWYRVKSGKRTGWVRMLRIQRSEARKGSVSPAAVAALATGRAGTGRVVATTGIRGLSEEELKLARHNEAELAKLEAHAVARAEAKEYARKGGLAARAVD